MTRLPEQRGERIDRDTEVAFTFDGRDVYGFVGTCRSLRADDARARCTTRNEDA